MPEALEQQYGLHSRELGADTLNRLLRLRSVMSSALRVSPPQAQARARRRPLLPGLCASPGVGGDTGPCKGERKLGNPMNQAAWSQR